MYKNAVKTFYKELDIVSILRTIRKVKTSFDLNTSQNQRFLLRMQRKHVISSDSWSETDTDYEQSFVDMNDTR